MEQAFLAEQQYHTKMIYFYRAIVSNFKYDWGFVFVTWKPKYWIVKVMHHIPYLYTLFNMLNLKRYSVLNQQ